MRKGYILELSVVRLAIALSIVQGLTWFMSLPAGGASLFSGLVLSQGEQGVKVVEVYPGSSANSSGIKVGDLLVEIEGVQIKTLEDFVARSKALEGKKPELALLILRAGKLQNATLSGYSVPVFKTWQEKVLPPPHSTLGGVSLFQYWTEKGRKKRDENKGDSPLDVQLVNCEEARDFFFYALHYSPTSLEVALLIADTYGTTARIYQDKGSLPQAVEYYKKSADLYAKCSKKTTAEATLKKILGSLQEVEAKLAALLPPEEVGTPPAPPEEEASGQKGPRPQGTSQ